MVSDGIEQARQLSSPASRTPLAFEGFFLKGGRLRARWRFLIFVALWALCERTLFSAAAPLMVRAQGSRLPLPAFLVWALSFLAVMIPTAVMARIERRPLRAYGLPARGAFGALFWKGAAWGLVALTARILALRAIGAYSFGEVALRGPDVARYGLSWALVFLMIALFELYALLGYPQVVLSTRIGFWPAATALSVFFGTIHLFNGGLRSGRFGVDWASGLFTGVLAVLFFFTLRRTGNLWFVVGLETGFNWGDGFLFSLPDGGRQAVGHLLSSHVQGSPSLTGGDGILDLMMLAALFVALHRRYPDVAYPPKTSAAGHSGS